MVEHKTRLDAVFGSLADPTRRDILRRVSRSPLTVGTIARSYDLTLQAISKHLRVLEQAKLVHKRRRGREFLVTLSPAALKDADAYLEKYREFWEERLDRLEEFLKNNMEPLIVERTFNAPVEAVWSALTDKEKIAKWFVPYSDFKAEKGFEFTFVGKTSDGTGKKHLCRVVEVVPHEKLSYSWRYDGRPGDSLVTWELTPESDGTKVRITHAGLETFPKEAAFARDNYRKGWTHFMGTLQALVETE